MRWVVIILGILIVFIALADPSNVLDSTQNAWKAFSDPNNKAPAAINNFAVDGTLCRPVWVTLKPGQEQTFEPQEGCKNLMWERENVPGKITLDFDGSNGVQSSTWTNDSEAPYYIGAYVNCVTLSNEGSQTVSLKFSYKN